LIIAKAEKFPVTAITWRRYGDSSTVELRAFKICGARREGLHDIER